mgnify:FL=1
MIIYQDQDEGPTATSSSNVYLHNVDAVLVSSSSSKSPLLLQHKEAPETGTSAPIALRLSRLSLSGCTQTNNRAIQILATANHEHLLHLNLNGCVHVGDQGCHYLSVFCPSLVSLSVGGCTEITSRGKKCYTHRHLLHEHSRTC